MRKIRGWQEQFIDGASGRGRLLLELLIRMVWMLVHWYEARTNPVRVMTDPCPFRIATQMKSGLVSLLLMAS
ncbi:hypothetical protein AAC387_Pa02g3082 [Persea americana]